MARIHHQWLQDASADIKRDYDRLYKKAADPSKTQLVGHLNEAIWTEFLSNWLPPQYEVATRKYIVGTQETASDPFESDLIIFHPGYPLKLRDKQEVLPSGVAAAFSTKLTARRSGLKEAAEHSAKLQRSIIQPTGHSRTELWKPFIYGFLDASHAWKAAASTPEANVGKILNEVDHETSNHPAESLDLACVADLGTWAKNVSFITEPGLDGKGEVLLTSHIELKADNVTPLTMFLSALYELLSWRNMDMEGMAHDFKVSNANTSGHGISRSWNPSSVMTHQALLNIREGSYEKPNKLDSPLQGMFVWSS